MEIKNLFNKGVSFEEFVNQDTDDYKEKTLEILGGIQFEADQVSKIEQINQKVYILICAEMWCPDCMINVPVIEKMRLLNDNISLSVVSKEGNQDFFKKYTPEEGIKIPTFVVFNKDFEEMGSLVEHPKAIKDILASSNQANRIVAMRKYRKGEYAKETLEDILKIIL